MGKLRAISKIDRFFKLASIFAELNEKMIAFIIHEQLLFASETPDADLAEQTFNRSFEGFLAKKMNECKDGLEGIHYILLRIMNLSFDSGSSFVLTIKLSVELSKLMKKVILDQSYNALAGVVIQILQERNRKIHIEIDIAKSFAQLMHIQLEEDPNHLIINPNSLTPDKLFETFVGVLEDGYTFGNKIVDRLII